MENWILLPELTEKWGAPTHIKCSLALPRPFDCRTRDPVLWVRGKQRQRAMQRDLQRRSHWVRVRRPELRGYSGRIRRCHRQVGSSTMGVTLFIERCLVASAYMYVCTHCTVNSVLYCPSNTNGCGLATRCTYLLSAWCDDVGRVDVTLDGHGFLSVRSRECGQGAGTKCSEMELGDATATVCSCQGDLCNHATRVHASASFGLVLLLSTGLLAKALVEAEGGERRMASELFTGSWVLV